MEAVLYTHTCADGFGSAVVFTKALGLDYPNVIYSSYTELSARMDELLAGPKKDIVIIADMHPTEEYMRRLDKWATEWGVRLLLYDHHISAARFAREYRWVHVNLDVSSSMLMLRRISKDTLYPWDPDRKTVNTIMKVDAWDKWRLSDRYRGGGEAIARYVDLVGVQQAVTDYLVGSEFMFSEELSRLLGVVETKEVGRAVAGMRMFTAGEYLVSVLYAERARFGFGIVSDTAFDLYPDLDYVIIVNVLDGLVTIRSIKHDVLSLVLPIGGGGDLRSAGFVLSTNVTLSQQWEEHLVSSIFVGTEVKFHGLPT